MKRPYTLKDFFEDRRKHGETIAQWKQRIRAKNIAREAQWIKEKVDNRKCEKESG